MKHRTNESSELNGVQQHNGTFPLRWLQEQPMKSNGARIKVTLSANLVAAIKANGNCQCSPLWDWTHFGWRQWLKYLKIITVGAENPFTYSCSASWAFCACWEDSGSFQHQAWSFWERTFPGSFFKFSEFLIYNYHTAKHCADIILSVLSANSWVGWFAYSHFQHFKIDWKYVLLYK